MFVGADVQDLVFVSNATTGVNSVLRSLTFSPEDEILTTSHGTNSLGTDKTRFQLEFDWTGTDDPTAYMCVPEAIAFMGSLLPGGWTELMQQNHQLVLQARQLLCEALEVQLPCPEEMIGSMAVVPKYPRHRGTSSELLQSGN